MVWCGFDESMRSGMVEFASGIGNAIADKAKTRGVSVSEQIARERYELKLLEELVEDRLARGPERKEGEGRLRLKAFLGMISIARFLIERLPDMDEAAAGSPPNFYADAFALGSLIERFDAAYERQPPKNGHEANVVAGLLEIFGALQIIQASA